MKRRALSPEPFDEFDSENIDPSILASPSKRSKGLDGGSISKASKFTLHVEPQAKARTPIINNTTAKRNTTKLSLSVPTTSSSTPIAHSRGSPKHKRVGLLSTKPKRRFSSSPFRRVDPPAFTSSKPTGLPFSIDAALSGTLASYKAPEPEDSKSMPKSWFFDIHVDTAEEEAANMMEHSASVLDISSDDDGETKRARDLEERGKENIPPPDFVAPVRAPRGHAATNADLAVAGLHKGISNKLKASLKAQAVDAMVEDRAALGEMDAQDFYPEGLDEKSVEVVEVEKGKGKEGDQDAELSVPIAEADGEPKEIYVRPDTAADEL
jgi:hypothetical protein